MKTLQKKITVSLSPRWMNDREKGLSNAIQPYINKYDESLGGALMKCKSIKVIGRGRTHMSHPLVHYDLECDFSVFRPKTGKEVSGEIVDITAEYMNVLVLRAFHCQIQRNGADWSWNEDDSWTVGKAKIRIGSFIDIAIESFTTVNDQLELQGAICEQSKKKRKQK